MLVTPGSERVKCSRGCGNDDLELEELNDVSEIL